MSTQEDWVEQRDALAPGGDKSATSQVSKRPRGRLPARADPASEIVLGERQDDRAHRARLLADILAEHGEPAHDSGDDITGLAFS